MFVHNYEIKDIFYFSVIFLYGKKSKLEIIGLKGFLKVVKFTPKSDSAIYEDDEFVK